MSNCRCSAMLAVPSHFFGLTKRASHLPSRTLIRTFCLYVSARLVAPALLRCLRASFFPKVNNTSAPAPSDRSCPVWPPCTLLCSLAVLFASNLNRKLQYTQSAPKEGRQAGAEDAMHKNNPIDGMCNRQTSGSMHAFHLLLSSSPFFLPQGVGAIVLAISLVVIFSLHFAS